MRKMSLILAVVLLVTTLAVPAMAAQPRAVSVIPSITVEGNTATCYVSCVGERTSDELVATMRLYRGSTLIDSWVESGNGYVFSTETRTVTSGYTYTLTVDLVINGNACPTFSASDS